MCDIYLSNLLQSYLHNGFYVSLMQTWTSRNALFIFTNLSFKHRNLYKLCINPYAFFSTVILKNCILLNLFLKSLFLYDIYFFSITGFCYCFIRQGRRKNGTLLYNFKTTSTLGCVPISSHNLKHFGDTGTFRYMFHSIIYLSVVFHLLSSLSKHGYLWKLYK